MAKLPVKKLKAQNASSIQPRYFILNVLGLAGFLAFYGREVFDWGVDAVKDWKRRRDWGNRNR